MTPNKLLFTLLFLFILVASFISNVYALDWGAADEVFAAQGAKRVGNLDTFATHLAKETQADLLHTFGRYDEAFKVNDRYLMKIEFDSDMGETLGAYKRELKTIKLSDKVDPTKMKTFIMPHEIGHAKVSQILNIPDNKNLLEHYVPGFNSEFETPFNVIVKDFDEFATDKYTIKTVADKTKYLDYSKERLRKLIGNKPVSSFGQTDLISFKAQALEWGDTELVKQIDYAVDIKFAASKSLFNQVDSNSLLSRYMKATDIYDGIDSSSYIAKMNNIIEEVNSLR